MLFKVGKIMIPLLIKKGLILLLCSILINCIWDMICNTFHKVWCDRKFNILDQGLWLDSILTRQEIFPDLPSGAQDFISPAKVFLRKTNLAFLSKTTESYSGKQSVGDDNFIPHDSWSSAVIDSSKSRNEQKFFPHSSSSLLRDALPYQIVCFF